MHQTLRVDNCGYKKKSSTRFWYIVMVIKNSNTWLLYLYSIVILKCFLNKSNNHLESCQAFAGSFMKPDSSLKFLKNPEPVVLWFWILSNTRNPFYFLFFYFFKYPEPAVITRIKDPPHIGLFSILSSRWTGHLPQEEWAKFG